MHMMCLITNGQKFSFFVKKKPERKKTLQRLQDTEERLKVNSSRRDVHTARIESCLINLINDPSTNKVN